MYKPPATQAVVADLFLQVGKRRRINVSQAEVGRLYDKNKNSYSKKFKMKMQLLNEPHRSINRSLENTLSKSKKTGGTDTPQSKSRESLLEKQQPKEKQKEPRTTIVKFLLDEQPTSVKKIHARTKTQEVPVALNDSVLLNRTGRDSMFIKIEGEENFLESVETKEMLNEQYKHIIRQIEKVKETCQNEQKKVKNAQEGLKAKKKILADERKGVRILERIPQEISQTEKQLKAEKQEIYTMVEEHERKMNDLRQTLQQINDFKRAQLAKLETIDRLKSEEKSNDEKERRYQLERQKQLQEEAALLRQKSQLEQENRQLMKGLKRLKETVAPPLDIHRKHIERVERLCMQTDMQRVDAYLRAKQQAKSQKKTHQRLKEELAKKKDDLKQLRKKLEERKQQSEKRLKQVTDRANIMLELDQKLQGYDSKAR